MKKEKESSEEMKTSKKANTSKKQELSALSDDEILQGFKDCDSKIVREYFYGYCRVAYCIYDKRYDLHHKSGMDFFSLVHEYFLYLSTHRFKPLEDRKPNMSLKTWMVNGFRFLLLDKLKEVVKGHRPAVGHDSLSRHPAMPKDDARCGDTVFQEILQLFGLHKLYK